MPKTGNSAADWHDLGSLSHVVVMVGGFSVIARLTSPHQKKLDVAAEEEFLPHMMTLYITLHSKPHIALPVSIDAACLACHVRVERIEHAVST